MKAHGPNLSNLYIFRTRQGFWKFAQVEEVTVAIAKHGVAVLMKAVALLKKRECLKSLSEDIELVTPDGFLLQVDETLESQGVVDGDVLIVQEEQGTASGPTTNSAPTRPEENAPQPAVAPPPELAAPPPKSEENAGGPGE